MCALPPKADMCGATRDVRFGPIADIIALFDQLVGAVEHWRGHINSNGFGGPEVDHQLIFVQSLHWQVTRLLAFEYAIDVTRRSAPLFELIDPVRDQSAAGREITEGIDCR